VSSSAIVVKLDLERVKLLKPSGLHRHCLGITFVMIAVGAVVHHGRQPSDRIMRHLSSGEECGDGCGRMEMLATKHRRPPPFIWRGSIWGRNHGSVAPPDRGVKLVDLIRFHLLNVLSFEL
jgi:hypothetical protein